MTRYELTCCGDYYTHDEDIAVIRDQDTNNETLNLIEKTLKEYFGGPNNTLLWVQFDDLDFDSEDYKGQAWIRAITEKGNYTIKVSTVKRGH